MKLQRNTLDDRLLQMVLKFPGAGNVKGSYAWSRSSNRRSLFQNILQEVRGKLKTTFGTNFNRIRTYMKMQNLKCLLVSVPHIYVLEE